MAAELRGCMTDPSAPAPSVEAILHAVLPAKFVDHTHADALLSVCNTPGGEDRVREVYGDRVVVIPYVMPGFKLARACARLLGEKMTPQHDRGRPHEPRPHLLWRHGGNLLRPHDRARHARRALPRESARHGRSNGPTSPPSRLPFRAELAAFRRDLSAMMGAPAILRARRDAQAMGFISAHRRRPVVSQQGPATPDHVLRTKRLPMIGRDLAAYRAAYEGYFRECSARADPEARDARSRAPRDPGRHVGARGRRKDGGGGRHGRRPLPAHDRHHRPRRGRRRMEGAFRAGRLRCGVLGPGAGEAPPRRPR